MLLPISNKRLFFVPNKSFSGDPLGYVGQKSTNRFVYHLTERVVAAKRSPFFYWKFSDVQLKNAVIFTPSNFKQ